MTMKLHWSPKSPYVRKVMICAHELELTDRLELVRSVAAMLKPNERLMIDNPLSKIPTLVLDDGFAIFDSVVICEYLDTLHGGRKIIACARRSLVRRKFHKCYFFRPDVQGHVCSYGQRRRHGHVLDVRGQPRQRHSRS
jgi:glutathione S-transferase